MKEQKAALKNDRSSYLTTVFKFYKAMCVNIYLDKINADLEKMVMFDFKGSTGYSREILIRMQQLAVHTALILNHSQT